MFRKYQTTAEVYRAGYSTENGYQKSGYTATGDSYKGHLKAQSIDQLEEQNMYGKVFLFHTKDAADIQTSDRLKINGINYDVQGVNNFDGLSFRVKQCLIYKAD